MVVRTSVKDVNLPPDIRRVLERYPRVISLNGGGRATLRPLAAKDEKKLIRLFVDTPYEDLRCLHDDVTDPRIVRRWCRNIDYERVLPIIAEADRRIVADATLHRRFGEPMRTIGRFRIYVRPEYRLRGLGRALLHEIIDLATILDLRRLAVELYEDQHDIRGVMLRFGFHEAGRIPVYQRVILTRDLPAALRAEPS
jgi:GNAT superfamily N-acetyltransferase